MNVKITKGDESFTISYEEFAQELIKLITTEPEGMNKIIFDDGDGELVTVERIKE